MEQRVHLPSIIGCAIGFSAAGSGIGSLVGTAIGPWFFKKIPEGQGTPHERLMAYYGGTYWGIAVGIVVGAAVGVLYAVIVRRLRRRDWAPDVRSDHARE